jgi:mannosyl-3-phosphoglycerate phosphatase
MQPFPSMLVFCDLDDTLFEPRTFSVNSSTRRALARLEREHLPLVFSSSKTRAELELIQHELGISHPFICESGGAVFVPQAYFGFNVAPALGVAGYEVVEFGKPYTEVVAALHRAADRLDIAVAGFNDMSVEEVAIDCGLPLLQARLAKLREYSELFRVVDAKPGALSRLFKALRGAGLDCTSRGAYHHLGSVRRDPGMQFLRGLYRRVFGDVVTVAFGDHQGAAELLRHADVPLVVRTDTPDETRHLLDAVPAARLSAADSLDAWVRVILDLADAAQRSRSSCSP